MDADNAAAIRFGQFPPRGVSATIVMMSAQIISDAATIRPLTYNPYGSACAGYLQITTNLLALNRLDGGYFDNANYDGTASTVANRGWAIIEYQA